MTALEPLVVLLAVLLRPLRIADAIPAPPTFVNGVGAVAAAGKPFVAHIPADHFILGRLPAQNIKPAYRAWATAHAFLFCRGRLNWCGHLLHPQDGFGAHGVEIIGTPGSAKGECLFKRWKGPLHADTESLKKIPRTEQRI